MKNYRSRSNLTVHAQKCKLNHFKNNKLLFFCKFAHQNKTT